MAERPNATRDEYPLFDHQKSVMERLKNALASRPASVELYAPAGFGKTMVVGAATAELQPSQQGKSNAMVWIGPAASIVALQGRDLQYNPCPRGGVNPKMLKKGNVFTTKNHILGMTTRGFMAHVSEKNVESFINEIAGNCEHLILVFDEAQVHYTKKNPSMIRRWASWFDPLKQALEQQGGALTVLAVTATPEIGDDGDQIRMQHDLMFGSDPIILRPTEEELQSHHASIAELPCVGKAKVIKWKEHSNAPQKIAHDLTEMVLASIMFSSASRPSPPFRAFLEDGTAVTVKEVSDDRTEATVKLDGEMRTVGMETITPMRTMAVAQRKSIGNAVAASLAEELVRNKKGLDFHLKRGPITATTKDGASKDINNNALFFWDNEFGIATLVSLLNMKEEDESGNMQPSRYKTFVLGPNADDNVAILNEAIAAIEDTEVSKIVLVFAHSSHRQGSNALACLAPNNFIVCGYETEAAIIQMMGRVGRHTEELDMPWVRGTPIPHFYFQSGPTKTSLALPSPKTQRALLLATKKDALLAMPDLSDDDAVKSMNKEQLVDYIIAKQGNAHKGKRKRKTFEPPFEDVDAQLRLEIDALQTIVESASEEERGGAEHTMEVTWNKIHQNEDNARFLACHPLVNKAHLKEIYPNIFLNRKEKHAFQERVYALVKEYRRFTIDDDDEEDDETNDLSMLRTLASDGGGEECDGGDAVAASVAN